MSAGALKVPAKFGLVPLRTVPGQWDYLIAIPSPWTYMLISASWGSMVKSRFETCGAPAIWEQCAGNTRLEFLHMSCSCCESRSNRACEKRFILALSHTCEPVFTSPRFWTHELS